MASQPSSPTAALSGSSCPGTGPVVRGAGWRPASAAGRRITSTPARPRRAGRGRWRGRCAAASTSHSRAWVSVGRHVVAEHVAVVVEAVEPVGQLAHPGRHLVRGPLDAGQLDHVGQLGQRPQQVELALVGEQARSTSPSGPLDAQLVRLPADRVDAGVGVLHVEDGRLPRLGPHLVEVDGRRLVDGGDQRQQPHHVGPDVVDQVVEVDGVAEPLADPPAGERHHLPEPDLEPPLLDAQRLDAGEQAGRPGPGGRRPTR